jgi:hypothetical protein
MRPVPFGPTVKCLQQVVEGAAKVSELVEGGGFDAARVDTPSDQAIALSPSQGAGQDLVSYPIETPAEIVVPASAVGQLSEDVQGPPAGQQLDDLSPTLRISAHGVLQLVEVCGDSEHAR